jgi:hypothetical protein
MSHRNNTFEATLMRNRMREYTLPEPIYISNEEFVLFRELVNNFPVREGTEAIANKLKGKDLRNLQVRPDSRTIHHRTTDARLSVLLPPRAPESRYPRATDVSSHNNKVTKSQQIGPLYATDYFRPSESEYNKTFVPLERKIEATPLSPIVGNFSNIRRAVSENAGIFSATQSAFQGNIPDAFKDGYITFSEA